jgi:hypothetical protein
VGATAAGKVQLRRDTAAALLDRADALLDRVEDGIAEAEEHRGRWIRADELDGQVARIRLQLATATLTVAAAVGGTGEGKGYDLAAPAQEAAGAAKEELHEQLMKLETQLEAELALLDAAAPPTADELGGSLDEATEAVERAEALATELRRRPALARTVTARANATRERIVTLVNRLEEL